MFFTPQLLRGAPDSLLRSLHVQKEPTAYNYIKVGGQIKVTHCASQKYISVRASPVRRCFFFFCMKLMRRNENMGTKSLDGNKLADIMEHDASKQLRCWFSAPCLQATRVFVPTRLRRSVPACDLINSPTENPARPEHANIYISFNSLLILKYHSDYN